MHKIWVSGVMELMFACEATNAWMLYKMQFMVHITVTKKLIRSES